MRGIALLYYTLLACSVAIFGETGKPRFLPNGCPETNMHWLLPHETDCTLYYTCNWGGMVLRQCGPGTHFNRVLQICDWPQNANCTTSSPSAPKPEPNISGPTTQGSNIPGPTTQGPKSPEATKLEPTASEANSTGPTTSELVPPEITTPASKTLEQTMPGLTSSVAITTEEEPAVTESDFSAETETKTDLSILLSVLPEIET